MHDLVFSCYVVSDIKVIVIYVIVAGNWSGSGLITWTTFIW